MRTERERLEQHRDAVLADIVELDQQVTDGEIPEQHAQRLRADYEAAVARALAALEQLPTEQPRRPRAATGTIARRTAYVATIAVAALAAGVLLPRYLAPRPDNGTVSGNVAQSQRGPATETKPASPPRDLSTVSNAQMEAVIARNPNVIGMRLALAERYLEDDNLDKAAEHYGTALEQQPDNPRVLAGAGRLLLAQGKPRLAMTYADRALANAPSSAAGLLLRAEITAAEPGDARAVRPVLADLLARPALDSDLRRRAEDLLRSLRSTSKEGR